MPTLSRYNHIWPWDDDYYIAYNAFAGTVALMTRANYETYTELREKLSSEKAVSLSEDERELLQQLQFGRFVVPDDFDERTDLKMNHYIDKYDRTSLDLSLAPTMGCNMACPYCYESNKSGRMSEDVMAAVVRFVENQSPRIHEMDVGWYGGEPLLAMDIIEQLSSSFIELSSRQSFRYGAAIITNGYLLTPSVADRLVDCKVTAVQVCLDGPARIHDERRPLKSGESSFETILNNVSHAADKMRVNVRINVDRDFRRAWVMELLDIIEDRGLRDKIGVYFGYINVASPVCANIAENCYNPEEFARVQVEYFKLLLDRGFRIHNEPSPKSVVCMGQSINAFLIDPAGDIFRCLVHAGDKTKSMGNIREPINYQHPNFTALFDPVPFDEPVCYECRHLPTCMGGCPGKIADHQVSADQLCGSWKHNIQPMLEIIARARLQELELARETADD